MGRIMKMTKDGRLVPLRPRPKQRRLVSHRPEQRSREIEPITTLRRFKSEQIVGDIGRATVKKSLRGEILDFADADDMNPYPYPTTPMPVPDVPVRIDGDDRSIYPYVPSSSAPDPDIPFNIGNIGTLMAPRPILQPWKTAVQGLFRAGDKVVYRPTNEIGQIRIVVGEEAIVVVGDRNLRVPIQELVLWEGPVKAIRQFGDDDQTRLTFKVSGMPKGIPKRDGSGRGVRANRGRGGCPVPKNRNRRARR